MSKISLISEYEMVRNEWIDDLLFSIHDLYHIYKSKYIETVALKELNLKIYRNDYCAILGPSGSGKTSLLKVLAGLIPCTAGRIYFNPESKDRDSIVNIAQFNLVERTLYRKLHIGYIPQEITLFDYLTVEENLEFPMILNNIGKEEADQKMAKILDLCNIEQRREYKIEQLSGGEKQRVQIAMALITEPKILIADEPTANLDSQNARSIFKFLKDICDSTNTSIIAVTHDPIIGEFANRKLHLKDGKIVY